MASAGPRSSSSRSEACLLSFQRVARIGVVVVGMLLAAGLGGCSQPPAEEPEFVFGRTGMGPLEFNYPRAAVIAPGGLLYVVDKAGRIQCFSQKGEFERVWRTPEIDKGKPTGLGCGPDGRIYAADTHYSRVLVYEPDGTLVRMFGEFGDGPGQFRLPTDVAVNAKGEIYVSEYGGNDRVSKFTPDWKFITSFGGSAYASSTMPDAPTGSLATQPAEAAMVRPQAILVAPDQTLWIADSCNHRICHFDADGKLLGTFGKLGRESGELNFPYNIDRLSDGTLLVCEYGNNRIQRFSAAGKPLGFWGRTGRHPGELAYPWALAIGQRDRVFVVDSGNNRVQVVDGLRVGHL